MSAWHSSLLTAFLLMIDQFSKGAVQSFFTLGESYPVINEILIISHRMNSMLLFGLVEDGEGLLKTFFTQLIPLTLCFFLIYLFWKNRKKKNRIGIFYTLLFIGLFGNLMDRWFYSHIVRFIEVKSKVISVPIFNIADICFYLGLLFLCLNFLVKLLRGEHRVSTSS